MSSFIKDEKLIEALDKIENKETELLTWGDINVFLSKSEIEFCIKQTEVPELYITEYFHELLKRCLIFQVGHDIYRSRMAETVRLQVLSRQWVGKQTVEEARPLISDFRFIKKTRQYPKRNHCAEKLIEHWASLSLLKAKHEKDILTSLLRSNEKWFKLSGFQVRSTERIIEKFDKHKSKDSKEASATIVCAGTGSGKTLSFYLPAMTKLASELLQDDSIRVRILAIYPRKELLKDQFSETYKEARKLDKYLHSHGKRKVTIGTFYGDTLWETFAEDQTIYEPMICPASQCSGVLKFNKQYKQVICDSCKTPLANDEVITSRERVKKNPPDILFTTTEMLNQRLSDDEYNHLFGINNKTLSIPLVLLDEVHTYEGSSGAQTSYLLKRWMAFSGIKPHFVGLSATLADAKNFFSDLTGTKPHNTELIESLDSELEEEGAEYMLALRGDPASQTGLLSATIQSTMLASRMLDTHQGPYKDISQGVFGQKTFVFTDDLDVINRLYNDYLDAEGLEDYFGNGNLKPSRRNEQPLAYKRSSNHKNYSERLQKELGQDWSSAESIGHVLDHSPRIERTSSQDSGVDHGATVVIATASLEVGYNDPDVGAVIQHKAPRNIASYLQRKGRAGRRRGTRPWMYTVLSDYGQDRIAFQQYEQLISPKVSTTKLPIVNSHIHKMHAALATLEWLVKQYNLRRTNIWAILKEPNKTTHDGKLRFGYQLKLLNEAVSNVLNNPSEAQRLSKHLKYALNLNEEQVKSVMWAPPRAIMMSFLPELKQSLQFKWGAKGKRWEGLSEKNTGPMPKYIAPQLFAALDTQNLSIVLDRSTEKYEKFKVEPMAFFQALKEYAPGRMTKRYTAKSINEPDWLVPSNFFPTPGTIEEINFDIEEAFGSVSKQVYQDEVNHDGEKIPVYQPRLAYSKRSSKNTLMNKSSSILQWGFAIKEPEAQSKIIPPKNSEWNNILKSIDFFTHDNSTPIEITRYTTGAKASIPFSGNKGEANVHFKWKYESKPVAIGAKLWVDSTKFTFEFSDSTIKKMIFDDENKKALYYQYLLYEFLNHESFEHEYFLANWIFECLMCALLILSHSENKPLSDVFELLYLDRGRDVVSDVIDSFFQRRETASGDEEQDLHLRLSEYFSNEDNIFVLKNALKLDPNYAKTQDYFNWGKELLGQTVCGGLNAMFLKLVSDVSDQSFNIDHKWEGSTLNVWINENEMGGVGYVTKFRELFKEDPLRTLGLLVHSFETGEYEQVNFDLQYFLMELSKNAGLQNILKEVREAPSLEVRAATTTTLRHQIAKLGILTTHAWNSILYSRVLKSGSNASSDATLISYLDRWNKREQEIDIEIPLHIMAFLLAKEKGGLPSEIFKQKNRIQAVLWQRGAMIRAQELSFYNPFNISANQTERLLLSKLITQNEALVDYDRQGLWHSTLSNYLESSGKATLVFTGEDRSHVKEAISRLNVCMIEYNKMMFYPRVTRVKTSFESLHVTIEIRDILQ
ncbi:protein DpdJ [Thalassotalea ponticola]|nr:protein DpdJ [Thalassotalea ponticola]MDN3652328.1 protein DpdJ [Thalassotalea ponticola]